VASLDGTNSKANNGTDNIGGQDAVAAVQNGKLLVSNGSTTANSLGLNVEYVPSVLQFVFLAEAHSQGERCRLHGNGSNWITSSEFHDSDGFWKRCTATPSIQLISPLVGLKHYAGFLGWIRYLSASPTQWPRRVCMYFLFRILTVRYNSSPRIRATISS